MLSRSSCPALFDYGKVAAPWMFFTGNIQIMTALSRIGKKTIELFFFTIHLHIFAAPKIYRYNIINKNSHKYYHIIL
jgi:hypothetical protein